MAERDLVEETALAAGEEGAGESKAVTANEERLAEAAGENQVRLTSL